MGDDMTDERRRLSRRAVERHAGDLSALGGVRSVVLGDGLERGVRVLEFKTAAGLRFDVLVDRAMDLGATELSGVSIAWASRTGVRHPMLFEHADERGLSFLRSMTGLLVTGGLDHTLFGDDVDASHYHYPPRPTLRHGLHGRVANLPARLLGYGEAWQGDRCVLYAEGEVRQAAMFAEHLRLRRRIEVDLDGTEIRVEDTVRNHGFDPTPHMFLYHINLGWPFLGAGTRVQAPIERTVWQSASVEEQGVSHLELPGPQPAFVEQVYEHALRPDERGEVLVTVTNPAQRRVELRFDGTAFGHFFEWLALREGDYALGLEPSTHAVAGDRSARDDGSMIWLGHGEERHYRTSLRFVDGP